MENRKPPLENNHEEEIRERWGGTPVYEEYREKTKEYSRGQWAAANLFMMTIFSEFADCMNAGAEVSDSEVQNLVDRLQAHITKYYYTCTDDILSGLGKMYVADERFRKNIDKYGKGTAAFVAEAIAIKTGV